jgi:polyether ionophore transport system permease protein
MSPARAIARRTLADSRVRTISFAALFALYGFVQVAAYRSSYSTEAERRAFAESFGNDKAIRLFYGIPHNLLAVSGYAAWRVGGVLAIFSAVFGALAAVRALRTEEEAGRQELVLAGVVSRRQVAAAVLAALAIETVVLWAGLFAGLAAGRLTIGGSAYLALATVTPIPVFVGVGALASQVFATRRQALSAAMAAVAIALAVRGVADTAPAVAWLRWLTPLGWAEELRPFASPDPAVLILPLAVAAALLLSSIEIWLRRDVGSGLVQTSDTAAPRYGLLSSPTAQALRSERGTLIAWAVGVGSLALIVGLLANSFTTSNLPSSLRTQIHKFGAASLTTPTGALATYFLFFVLADALFVCSQIASARREEAEQRLETLFALPVGRRSWLAGRVLLAAGGVAGLALVEALVAWAAASNDASVSFRGLMEAGLNCLPASLLFLGLATLAFAAWPRASVGLGYGLVAVTFLWDLVGALLGVPAWTLGLSPFHHVAFVPARPFATGDALAMLALALAATVLAGWLWERRDLATE